MCDAPEAVHASTWLFTHVGWGPCARVRLCRPGRQSPSALRVAELTRGGRPTARRGVSRSQSALRPSPDPQLARRRRACAQGAAGPARVSAVPKPYADAPHSLYPTMPAASSGLNRPASAASYAMRRTAANVRLIVAGAYDLARIYFSTATTSLDVGTSVVAHSLLGGLYHDCRLGTVRARTSCGAQCFGHCEGGGKERPIIANSHNNPNGTATRTSHHLQPRGPFADVDQFTRLIAACTGR